MCGGHLVVYVYAHAWNLCSSSPMHPSLPPPPSYARAIIQGITELGPKCHHRRADSVSGLQLLRCGAEQQKVVPCPLLVTPRYAYYLTLCVEPTIYVEQMQRKASSGKRQYVAACVSTAAGLSRLHQGLSLPAVVYKRAGVLCCHQTDMLM